MTSESASPEGDTEDDGGLYSRFTVSGVGPVVHEQEPDGVTIATKTQAQVERVVQDADDFSDVLGGKNPDHDIDAVRALIGDAENLRLTKGKPDRWDMASNWAIEVEADVDAWVALAKDEQDAKGLANRKGPEDVLEVFSRSEKNAGPNALIAGLSLAEDGGDVHTKLLERYLERFGPSREDFEDWLENQDEGDSDA